LRYLLVVAQSSTLSIRPRTRLAVDGFNFQSGPRIFITIASSIAATGSRPIAAGT
jgi:hypothetical protein